GRGPGHRLGGLGCPGARFRAGGRGAAAPHAGDVVEDVEAFGGALVAAVEDEPVRVDDGRGAEVAALVPVHRARAGAARAQDALGGVVEARAVRLRLDALAGGLVAGGGQVRLDSA